MVDAAHKLPLSSLAFVLAPEMLYLRIQRGFREIQVNTVLLIVTATRVICCFIIAQINN